jgi:hypothetical protein
MPKIVIPEIDFERTDIEEKMAAEAGIELEIFADRSAEAIIRNAHDADGIVCSYGDYSRKVFEALPNLKVISRTGVGYDTIDLQAATECGKQLTLNEVKQIMKETAIRDEWVTTGPNATHFGNGKIDALAGIKYILEQYGGHDNEVGDVNHDGEVDIADVTRLIDYLLNSEITICPVCADVYPDEDVNIADVTALIDRLLAADGTEQ